jgi:hypothetical protein
MKLASNPVFKEGVQIYLIEGKAFGAFFYLLGLLGLVQFAILFLPSLDPQGWMGSAYLFRMSAVAALMLVVYFVLRLAGQEYAPWKFFTLRRWLQQEGLTMPELAAAHVSLLLVYASALVLLSSPLLVWAGAISRADGFAILSTILLLFCYAVVYGFWGIVALAAWDQKLEARQVFVRCVFGILVFISALVYLPSNPIFFLLAHLEQTELPSAAFSFGLRVPGTAVHAMFQIAFLGAAVAAYARTLKRRSTL